jgi:hypothetical protein
LGGLLHLYNIMLYFRGLDPGLSGFSHVGGGEFGVLGKRATYLKPAEDQFKLEHPEYGEMVMTVTKKPKGSLERSSGEETLDQKGPVMKPGLKEVDLQGGKIKAGPWRCIRVTILIKL